MNTATLKIGKAELQVHYTAERTSDTYEFWGQCGSTDSIEIDVRKITNNGKKVFLNHHYEEEANEAAFKQECR